MHDSFSEISQSQFAQLSGDYNPIHMDPVAARRLLYGQQVVHGVHILLKALDRWVEIEDSNLRLTRLSAKFIAPTFLNQSVEFSTTRLAADSVKIVASSKRINLLTAKVSWREDVAKGFDISSLPTTIGPCRERSGPPVVGECGRIPLCLDRSVASRLFPHALRRLPPEQVAVLLGTSRVVGMETPGLHSLFTALDLLSSDETSQPELSYRVESYDERIPRVTLQVDGPGFAGSLTAVVRPAPKEQASCSALSHHVVAGEFRGERALVIGGSRGLGEVAAKLLVVGGAEVKLTYHQGELEARRVVSEILAHGGAAECLAYNVLTDAGSLAARLGAWRPTLLCYFATPFISVGTKGDFSSQKFTEFCEYYVRGFNDTICALRRQGNELRSVLCASSSLVVEVPANLGEYVAAKSAAESLCRWLQQCDPNIRVHAPRFPRLATDQTAGILAAELPSPDVDVLEALRALRASPEAA